MEIFNGVNVDMITSADGEKTGCIGWRSPDLPDERMNRVQADERTATFCHIHQHRFEIAKIPDPQFFSNRGV
ncbi:hypothetical protein ACNKHU_21175 [Shigella flexneri]